MSVSGLSRLATPVGRVGTGRGTVVLTGGTTSTATTTRSVSDAGDLPVRGLAPTEAHGSTTAGLQATMSATSVAESVRSPS